MSALSTALSAILALAGASTVAPADPSARTGETAAVAATPSGPIPPHAAGAAPVPAAAASMPATTAPMSSSNATAPSTAQATAPMPVSGRGSFIAANTPLILETLAPLSSATLQRGEKFGLRLAEPLLIDGAMLLPAGTLGVGEVIHAERSRSGGKAGELLLAARYLEHDGRRIDLRGFRLGASGVDKSGKALGLAFAVGAFAMFVRGGEIEIPAHTQAQARTSIDVDLSLAQTPAPPAAAASVPPVTQPSGEAVQ